MAEIRWDGQGGGSSSGYGMGDLIGDIFKGGQQLQNTNASGQWGNQNVNDSGWWNYMTNWGNANYNRQNGLDQMAGQERMAGVAAEASKYPHLLKQERFGKVFPWMQTKFDQSMAGMGQGNPRFAAQSAPAAAPQAAAPPQGQPADRGGAMTIPGNAFDIAFQSTSRGGGGPSKVVQPFGGGGGLRLPTGQAQRPGAAAAPAAAPGIALQSANPQNPYFDRTGIDVNALFTPQQIRDKTQNVQGNNTASAQGALRRAQDSMGPDSYNTGGRNALERQYGLQALAANNQAGIDIPMQLGTANAQQLLAQQTARNQGALGWANNDLGYDQLRGGQMNAMIAALAGLV
jgi:hypothetical protein